MNSITQTADKIIPRIAVPLIITAAVLLIVFMISDSRNTSTQNNAYIRVINCIVSYNATERRQEDIESCYRTVEYDLDIKLQRYDSSAQR